MKNTNKKGFTIVELVIVIAVIAILAGVLIPTFASLIRKANISSDIHVARNLNTLLTSEEAAGNKPTEFDDVLTILRENGYVVGNLNPTTNGCYFVWESESNQIIFVDGENDFEILYQLKDCTPIGATWNFAVSNSELAEELKAAHAEITVIYTPKSLNDLHDVLQEVYTNGGKQEVVITEDIVLNKDIKVLLDKADGEVSLDLGDNTMTTAYGSNSTLNIAGRGDNVTKAVTQFTAASGILNIANGTLESSADSAFVATAINVGKVFLDGVTATNNTVGQFIVLRVLGNSTTATETRAHMEIKDSTIIANGGAGVIETGSGTATFINTTATVKASDAAGWWTVCLNASYGGVTTVESGTYTQENADYAVVGFFTSEGTINLNGGTFVNTADDKKIFSFMDCDRGDQVINIKGGNFAGAEWNTFDAKGWAELCGYETEAAANAAGVTITGIGSDCVTIKNAKN